MTGCSRSLIARRLLGWVGVVSLVAAPQPAAAQADLQQKLADAGEVETHREQLQQQLDELRQSSAQEIEEAQRAAEQAQAERTQTEQQLEDTRGRATQERILDLAVR